MEDHNDFLARQIITDDKLITYRTLSRTMKVHVNLAKQMLYDFHKTYSAKNPGSLHVTYLVYGTRKTSEDEQDDDDVDMTDSVTDMDATFSQAVPTRTLSLIREEALQETLEQYAEVTSIHIYSVAPHPMRDLQFLADAAQQVVEMSIQEDFSVGANKTYGTLINPNTRKRERRAGAPPPAAPAKAQPKPQVKQETKPTINLKEEPKSASTKDAKDSKLAANTTAKKVAAAASAPALKRQGSSGGIGQMFAKQASKPKKPAAAKPKEEALAPALSDEGEDDSEAMPEAKQATEEDGKSRRDRQAELRRMMDESDGEEEDESKSKPESPADEPMDEDPAPSEPEAEADEGPAEIVASTGDGRRRGRRRVMKKKQIMDEQGYLVTIQEQGWESFSEEEKPAPKPQQAKPAAAEKAAPAGKPKKSAPKGQGNIMSFFGKK